MYSLGRIFIFLLLLSLWSSVALAGISGEAELNYVNYRSKTDRFGKKTVTQFAQRYSVFYEKQGLLYAGRAGHYNLGIGADWSSFDTKSGDEKISDDSFKFLYNGHITIAPGAMPFRLNAYSYDLSNIRFDNTPYAFGSSVIAPRVVTALDTGETIVSGVQFIGGIKNGSYLGQYRDLLSQWPRLLIDYRDMYRKDTEARFPVNYRQRDLAFVSLNKKDNWFHYRLYAFDDYENKGYNSRESTILLGTIDHKLQRKWINLTNWIRISADGSYRVIDESWAADQEKRFDVNFFTSFRTPGLNADSLLRFERVKQGPLTTKSVDAPIFVTKRFNPTSSLRSNTQIWMSQDAYTGDKDINSIYSGNGVGDENDYYTGLMLDHKQKGRLLIKPRLEMEVRTGDLGEGEAARGSLEFSRIGQTGRYSSLFATGSLGVYSGTSPEGEKGSLWEGQLEGGLDYRLSNNMSVGGDQFLVYGNGTSAKGRLQYLNAVTEQRFGGTEANELDGWKVRSSTLLYFEHISSARLRNRFEIIGRFEDSNDKNFSNLEVSHSIKYSSRIWDVDSKSIYYNGDDTPAASITSDTGNLTNGRDGNLGRYKEAFENRSTFNYYPNRTWSGKVSTDFYWGKDSERQTVDLFKVRQEMEYRFFKGGRSKNILGEINQWFEYIGSVENSSNRAFRFTLSGEYFPTARNFWSLGTRVDYYYYNNLADTVEYDLWSSFDFTKFKVDLNYKYGSIGGSENVAHRYEVNVKKLF